ncbi:hypothetical protein OIV83_005373 [Microbotryomycetes sp. JL201]|nr:hypothetical protein OIV83_005373 [Microbotryomycetes sp. JL201]
MRLTSTTVLLCALATTAFGESTSPIEDYPSPTRTLQTRQNGKNPPFNVNNPAPTPAFTMPALPKLLDVNQLVNLVGATTAPVNSLLGQAATRLLQDLTSGYTNPVVGTVQGLICGLFGCNAAPPPPSGRPKPVPSNVTCLNGTYDAATISSLFYFGGANTIVYLCPNAVLNLVDTIHFTDKNQTLQTGPGSVDPSQYATLRVTGRSQSTAVYTAADGRDGATLRNVIVDGNRPNLGWGGVGSGPLIQMGGNNKGQLIENVKAFEPRGWTALHLIEGFMNSCQGMTVRNNQMGPSGNAASVSGQKTNKMRRMSKRQSGGGGSSGSGVAAQNVPAGQWADGISLACKGSTVTGNTVVDATDVGIVIFGAPGSKVTGNTVISRNRVLLGGINAADYLPFFGSFKDVVVSGNTINAEGNMIKIGMTLGTLSWGDFNSTLYRTNGGTFNDNTFTSGSTGYFGYGVSVNGHNAATVRNNKFTSASFGGQPTASCRFNPMPAYGPMYFNPYTTPGSNLQSQFQKAVYDFAICHNPGQVARRGVNVY